MWDSLCVTSSTRILSSVTWRIRNPRSSGILPAKARNQKERRRARAARDRLEPGQEGNNLADGRGTMPFLQLLEEPGTGFKTPEL
jgi:hypothetical protein